MVVNTSFPQQMYVFQVCHLGSLCRHSHLHPGQHCLLAGSHTRGGQEQRGWEIEDRKVSESQKTFQVLVLTFASALSSLPLAAPFSLLTPIDQMAF